MDVILTLDILSLFYYLVCRLLLNVSLSRLMALGEEERAVFLLSFAINFVVSVRRSNFCFGRASLFHYMALPWSSI